MVRPDQVSSFAVDPKMIPNNTDFNQFINRHKEQLKANQNELQNVRRSSGVNESATSAAQLSDRGPRDVRVGSATRRRQERQALLERQRASNR